MKKIYNFSLLITSAFVYFVWSLTKQIDLNFINNVVIQKTVEIAIDFILAFGFFHLCANIIVALSSNISFLKRIILGSSYIEGIWVGYYLLDNESEGKKTILYIEQIEQTLDDITLVAEAYYYDDRKPRCIWNDVTAKIDKHNNSLIYVINVSFFHETPATNSGVTYYRMQNKGRSSSPEKFIGYSMNIGNQKKETIKAIKVSKIPHSFSTQQLLDKAMEFYQSDNK